jgi:lipid-A-disaccharide synthase
MVVSYRMGKFSYKLLSSMVKVPYVSLPNLLADEALVPELLQDDATVGNLTEAVLHFFEKPDEVTELKQRFTAIHRSLQYGGNETAAKALAQLIQNKTNSI